MGLWEMIVLVVLISSVAGVLRERGKHAGSNELNLLLAEVQELNEEKVEAPPADEHVH